MKFRVCISTSWVSGIW